MKEIPEKILDGRYRILSQLGKGAFGSTFLAEDMLIPGKRRCVVKKSSVPDESRKTQLARRLLQREGETLEKLGAHSQIPQLLAYFEEDQNFYSVWEFIEGHDLNYELRSGDRWSETETVALLKEVLEILVFFHDRHFIHRDIKPDNLIRRQSDGKIVILIDLWALKNLALEEGSLRSSVIIGTPGYMPREQLEGRPRLNSDIYALGMVAIQALTGVMPHLLSTNPETGEVIWRDRAEVGSRLANILEGMVQPDPNKRYQSARDVLHSFQWQPKIAMSPVPSRSRTRFMFIQTTSMVSALLGLLLVYLLNAYSLFFGLSWFLVIFFLLTTVLEWLLIKERIRSSDSSGKNRKNVWESGKRVIALAAGGAFLGGLTAQLTGAAIGICLGAIFGYFYGEDGAASSYPASSDGESRENIWKGGDRLIVFTSGGVLLGGLIAQLPGSIMGATLGAAFGLLAKIDTN